MKPTLSIYYNYADVKQDSANQKMMFSELVQIAKSSQLFKHILKYSSVNFYCGKFTAFPKPFLTAILCRILTSGACRWVDADGNERKISLWEIFQLFATFIYEQCTYQKKIREIETELNELQNLKSNVPFPCASGSPLYLYSNIGYGYIAGGSIGHIAGVLNNLEMVTGHKPLFLTTDTIPTVSPDIVPHMIDTPMEYRNVSDASGILYNRAIYDFLERKTKSGLISFIYQRNIRNVYAGIHFAIQHNLPFVLEYNAPSIWVMKNWGRKKARHLDISERIEKLNLLKATLIVCVSQPLKDQLVERGIHGDKIIVIPNGVNTQMYRPEIDGDKIRTRLGIDKDKIVIGFIGTFGPWHGADVLAKAFLSCLKEPEWKDKLFLLMIGTGDKYQTVKTILDDSVAISKSYFPGTVPQSEGPLWMAACDILCVPTVPNQDGSPFFGSPTKLFEYMAMGKAIVASNIAQPAEILEDGVTALLTRPNDILDLKKAILRLAEDENLRHTLGTAARRQACERHTWMKNAQKMYDALKERL